MLDALTILETFVACYVWRYITVTWLEDSWKDYNPWVRLALQYYTIIFVGFAYLVYDNAKATFEGLYAFGFINPTEFWTNSSNLELLRDCSAWTQNASIMPTPLNWTDAELHEIRFDSYGAMRVLVMFSCPAVVATQVIVWVHISKHLMRIKNSKTGKLEDNKSRDKAIQIMLLPVMYSVVAFNNVIRLMNLFSGEIDLCTINWGLSFKEKKAYTLTLYEANLSMADFYEAIALLRFSTLTVNHIKEHYLRSGALRSGALSRMDTSHAEKDVNTGPVLKVNRVLSDLVETGVLAFCATCFLTFARGLNMVWRMAVYKTPMEAGAEGSVPSMISGAGFLASTVAIANVVKVELAFHEELHAFRPGLKFWSTKVIVSIAFIQEALLGLLGYDWVLGDNKLSEVQINLLYCSLLCYEVLFVGLLHVYAWPADVAITAEERKKPAGDGEYWDEDSHAAAAMEPLLPIAE